MTMTTTTRPTWHFDLIDAMTKSPFRGNPTLVFILDHEHQGCDFPVWPDDAVLQAVARELNQSDVIFVRPITRAEGVVEHVEDVKTAESEGRNDVNGVREYLIRSFTTRKEEKFCGHGIFAAAYALEEGTGDEEGGRVLRFYTVGGIVVDARFVGGEGAEDKGGAFGKVRTLQVELPREAVVERTFRDEDVVKGKIARCLGISDDKILALGRNSLMDLVIEVSEEVDFSAASMEIDGVALMHACPQRTRSQIITGKEGSFGAEFVKRMFAYGSEDPGTGSTYCVLIPYWAEKLRKSEMKVKQVSERTAVARVVNSASREGFVTIYGSGLRVMKGEMLVPEIEGRGGKSSGRDRLTPGLKAKL